MRSVHADDELVDLGTLSNKALAVRLRGSKYQVAIAVRRVLTERATNADDASTRKEAIQLLSEYDRESRSWLVSVGTSKENAERPVLVNVNIFPKQEFDPKSISALFAFDLQCVAMEGPHITDRHVAKVLESTQIDTLDLFKTKVTGEGLCDKQLPSLLFLHLNDCPLEAKYVCNFTFSNLIGLDLAGSTVDEDVLSKLKLTALQGLYIERTVLSGDDFRHLKRFSKLMDLGVDLSQLDAAAIEAINASTITRLRVHYHKEDEASLKEVGALLRDNCALVPRLRK